jgi:hypothetical protein
MGSGLDKGSMRAARQCQRVHVAPFPSIRFRDFNHIDFVLFIDFGMESVISLSHSFSGCVQRVVPDANLSPHINPGTICMHR